MLQRMTSVLVVGPLEEAEQIVDTLYQEGTVHLVDLTEERQAPESRLARIDEAPVIEVDQLLLRVNGLLTLLPGMRDGAEGVEKTAGALRGRPLQEVLEEVGTRIEGLDIQTVERTNRKTDLELTAITLERYARILRRLQPIQESLQALEGFEMSVLLLQKEYAHVLDQVLPVLREITHDQIEYITSDLDEETIAAITIFNKWYSREVHAFLFSQNVNEVRIPEDLATMSIDDALGTIDQRREAGRAEILRIDGELRELAERWRPDLLGMQRVLEEQRDELAVFSRFAHTDYTFVAKGWNPRRSIPHARDRLERVFGGRVVLYERTPSPEEVKDAPTCFANPAWARPFEFFVRLMGPPRYQEVDPIPFMAIFFPLFFGLIVADVGYGLCILALAAFLRSRAGNPDWLRELSMIFIISSIPTIIFGYLFGELFGDFGEVMGWLHPVTFAGVTWNRMEAMIPLLVLSIAIGAVHIFLGLGLGVANAVAQHNRRHLCEKCGMIAVTLGIMLLILALITIVSPLLLVVGGILLLVGLPLLFYGGGVQGAVEIMGTVGNIMSYARIMAIGMASVMLAVVANELAGAVGTVLIGGLVAVVLHLMNLVMGMFSPFIQSIRLHLVEFNSKFYQGGGRPYRPFGYRPGE
ncbi:MAG: V-type ATP synthase subunit I [Methanoregulaceae archaeon]